MWKCQTVAVAAFIMTIVVTAYPFARRAVESAYSRAKDWVLETPKPQIHPTDLFADPTLAQLPHYLSPETERNPPEGEIEPKYRV